MVCCTFFGHRDCPELIENNLRSVLTLLIEQNGVDQFYVGNQGRFDLMVHRVLKEFKPLYPHIHYDVVLAYRPTLKTDYEDYSDTILPDGIEGTPPRFAVSWRNRWMLKRSTYVVSYITRDFGGASRFAEEAKRQKKQVINLAEL